MHDKSVLFFRNSYDSNSFFSFWHEAVFSALKKLGREPIYVNMSKPEEALKILNAALGNGCVDFAISFQNDLPMVKLTSGEYLLDKLNIPCVCWLLDIGLSPNNTGVYMPLQHLLIAALNEDEPDFLRKFATTNIHSGGAFFLPLGGSYLSHRAKCENLNKRKFCITFTGSYYSFFERKWPHIPEYAQRIINAVIDDVSAHPNKPILKAAQYVFKNLGLNLSDDKFTVFCRKYINYANLYLRSTLRLRALESLVKTGAKIDIFGGVCGLDKQGWRNWKYAHKVKLHPPISYEESLKIAEQSQIVFNVGVFPGGLHDRVPSCMMAGAVAVTDSTTYTDRCFKDGEDLLVYNWHNLDELPDKIDWLLANPNTMQEVADCGRKKAFLEHTWEARVSKLLGIVDLYKSLT